MYGSRKLKQASEIEFACLPAVLVDLFKIVFFLKPIHPATGIHEFLLTRKERMAR